MTPHFIKLPSGNWINPNLVTWFSKYDQGIRYQLANDGHEDFNCETGMDEEQFLALLSPPTTAIVSPVLDLDRLKVGAGCCFTYEGVVKHGVIKAIGTGSGGPWIEVSVGENEYTIWTKTGSIDKE